MRAINYSKLLYRKYILPVDPCLQHLRFTFKLLIAVLIAVLLEYFLHFNEGLFIILGAFFTALPTLPSNSFKQSITTACYATIFVVLAILAGSYLGHFSWAYIGIMFLWALLGYHCGRHNPSYMMVTVMSLVALLISAALPALNLHTGIARLINTAYGGAITIITFLILLPIRREKYLEGLLKANLYNIKIFFWLALNNAARGNFHRDERYEKRHEIFDNIHKLADLMNTTKIPMQKRRFKQQHILLSEVISFTDYLSQPSQENTLDLVAQKLNDFSGALELAFPKPEHAFIDVIEKNINLFKTKENIPAENQQDLEVFEYLFKKVKQGFANIEVYK